MSIPTTNVYLNKCRHKKRNATFIRCNDCQFMVYASQYVCSLTYGNQEAVMTDWFRIETMATYRFNLDAK